MAGKDLAKALNPNKDIHPRPEGQGYSNSIALSFMSGRNLAKALNPNIDTHPRLESQGNEIFILKSTLHKFILR
jgi:hypothetical protein